MGVYRDGTHPFSISWLKNNRQEVFVSLEPSYSAKYTGMHAPAQTLPAHGCVPPVPLPEPIAVHHGCYPKQACAQPAMTLPAHAGPPCCPKKRAGSAGTILVLFILLVIISRHFPYGGAAKVCKK